MTTPPNPPQHSGGAGPVAPYSQFAPSAPPPAGALELAGRPPGHPVIPERAQSRQFAFDGGAATYFGTGLLAFFITVLTLGLMYPFAVVLRERWRAKHSWIEGRQLIFNGSAWGLFGLWWKWLILIIVTIGIYSLWVGPRIYRWKWEHTTWALQSAGQYGHAVRG